jgi:hypothetical protein
MHAMPDTDTRLGTASGASEGSSLMPLVHRWNMRPKGCHASIVCLQHRCFSQRHSHMLSPCKHQANHVLRPKLVCPGAAASAADSSMDTLNVHHAPHPCQHTTHNPCM